MSEAFLTCTSPGMMGWYDGRRSGKSWEGDLDVDVGEMMIGPNGPTRRTLRTLDNVPGSPTRLYAIWHDVHGGGSVLACESHEDGP